jgi:hypothetical protein
MLFHLLVILILATAWVLFGLLRADACSDSTHSGACDSCPEEAEGCSHFCFRQPMTRLSRLFRAPR